MIYLILILLILFIFMLISVYVHEYSHALFAKLLGWKLHGMTMNWKRGSMGYKVEINEDNPQDLWKIAAGGLLGSLALMLVSLGFSILWPGFLMLVYINFFIVLINIIPFKGSDGYYIFKRVIKYFRHPNDLHSET